MYLIFIARESRFALNETTGEISIRSAAKLVTCDIISLSVTARDSGVPVMEAFAQVHVSYSLQLILNYDMPIS